MRLTASFDDQPLQAGTLTIAGLRVAYSGAGEPDVQALDIPTLSIPAGEHVGITGRSGAGKSTLLHALAGILRPTAGSIRWGSCDITALSEPARDRWRRRTVGIVFQDFHLVPELSVIDNILLPITFDGFVHGAARAQAQALVERLGLPDLARRAAVLSRGEQQRVAIARALIRRPTVILADEPTASLDTGNGQSIADLLVTVAGETGATLVVATHDTGLIQRFSRVHSMVAGRIEPERDP